MATEENQLTNHAGKKKLHHAIIHLITKPLHGFFKEFAYNIRRAHDANGVMWVPDQSGVVINDFADCFGEVPSHAGTNDPQPYMLYLAKAYGKLSRFFEHAVRNGNIAQQEGARFHIHIISDIPPTHTQFFEHLKTLISVTVIKVDDGHITTPQTHSKHDSAHSDEGSEYGTVYEFPFLKDWVKPIHDFIDEHASSHAVKRESGYVYEPKSHRVLIEDFEACFGARFPNHEDMLDVCRYLARMQKKMYMILKNCIEKKTLTLHTMKQFQIVMSNRSNAEAVALTTEFKNYLAHLLDSLTVHAPPPPPSHQQLSKAPTELSLKEGKRAVTIKEQTPIPLPKKRSSQRLIHDPPPTWVGMDYGLQGVKIGTE